MKKIKFLVALPKFTVWPMITSKIAIPFATSTQAILFGLIKNNVRNPFFTVLFFISLKTII